MQQQKDYNDNLLKGLICVVFKIIDICLTDKHILLIKQ